LKECSEAVKMESMRLYKRKASGVWYISFGRGKEKSLKTGDEAQAKRIYKKVQEEVLKGRLIQLEAGSNITLKEFKKEYIEYRTKRKAPATVKADSLALRKLLDHLGNKPLHMISQKALDQFHTDLLDQGAQATSVNVYIRHLKAAFSQAVEWEYIKRNPYAKIKQLVEQERLPHYLNGEKEFTALFNAIKDPEFAVMVYWYLYTGCRRAELVNLKWTDVLENVIVIRKTKGKRVKIIPTPEDLKDIIGAMEKTEGFVFPRWRGVGTVTHLFERAAKAAGLDLRLHDLRHTTASHLAMLGVPQKQIQEILGHAQLSTTDIYTHLSPEHLRAAMDKLHFAGKLQAEANGKVISIEEQREK